ncbi:hypothetical protein BS17DRAFT_880019 [Gyrodon lividus]|nr:hypothetical protein BS17DRAFT_880019 [Gyrodon lividus]
MAVISGGDYNEGIQGCGIKIAHGLSQYKLGKELLDAFLKMQRTEFTCFLHGWRNDLRRVLDTDPDGFLGRKYTKLAGMIPDSFHDYSVLELYTKPLTIFSSCSDGLVGGWCPYLIESRQPCLGMLATLCKWQFGWTDETTVAKMRATVWEGAAVRLMCGLPKQPGNKMAFKSILKLLHRWVVVTTGSKLVVFKIQYHGRQFADAAQTGLSLDGPKDEEVVYLMLPACVVEHALLADAKCFTDQCTEQMPALDAGHDARERAKWSAPDDFAEEESDPYQDPEFPHAFNRTPNKCSDKALALFLMYKGFHQNLGKGTVEGIWAAFKDLDGDTYRGRWHFDQIRQRWEGNPTESAEVNDIVSSLKHKASSEDGDRKHSLPMSKDFMDRMLLWSLKACPLLDVALDMLQRILAGKPASVRELDLAERTLVIHHLEQIAFDATTWTLWTRCFKLVKVKRWHITIFDSVAFNHVLKKYLAHESLVLSDRSTYFDVYLKNRKGWQRKVDKGQTEPDLRSNHYKIYPQPDLPGFDTFFWLLLWITWLEVFHYNRTLEPDDCIFPAMGANGIIQPREPLSHDTVQKWIHEVTSSYSVPKAGLIIPDVPVPCSDGTCHPKKELWRDIVKHWPPEWTQGNNQASVITLKFINTYQSDEARFLAAYPQAERGHTALLHAVNAARRERGKRPARKRRNRKSEWSSD